MRSALKSLISVQLFFGVYFLIYYPILTVLSGDVICILFSTQYFSKIAAHTSLEILYSNLGELLCISGSTIG